MKKVRTKINLFSFSFFLLQTNSQAPYNASDKETILEKAKINDKKEIESYKETEMVIETDLEKEGVGISASDVNNGLFSVLLISSFLQFIFLFFFLLFIFFFRFLSFFLCFLFFVLLFGFISCLFCSFLCSIFFFRLLPFEQKMGKRKEKKGKTKEKRKKENFFCFSLSTDIRQFDIIILDGTWNQAKQMSKEISKSIPHIKLEATKPTISILRKQSSLDRVTTAEAVAFLLEVSFVVVSSYISSFFGFRVSTLLSFPVFSNQQNQRFHF